MIKTIVIIGFIAVTLSAKDTVVDREIDLMWQDSSSIVQKDWSGAKAYCQNLSLDGYNDWRLPLIDELMSICDKTKYKPAIKSIFSNTKNNYYWSSTEYKNNSYEAWIVDFYNGYDYYNYKSGKNYVRCVRGGQ